MAKDEPRDTGAASAASKVAHYILPRSLKLFRLDIGIKFRISDGWQVGVVPFIVES